MWNRFDQLAKALIAALLRLVTQVETAREIHSEVLIADVWAATSDKSASELERLGVLGRMMGLGECLIEPFSQPPRMSDIRSCTAKQNNRFLELDREASRNKRPEPAYPNLWVISSGRPQTVMDTMKLEEMDEWPDGFWRSTEHCAFHLIVVRDLPKTPETLFLRLLGRGPTFRRAVHELATKPEHTWARELLAPMFVAFRTEIPQDSIEEEDMEALRELEVVYQEWEQRVKDEAHQTGVEAGRKSERREVLLKLLSLRFGDVAESERERIEQAEMDDLELWTDRIISAATLADVFQGD